MCVSGGESFICNLLSIFLSAYASGMNFGDPLFGAPNVDLVHAPESAADSERRYGLHAAILARMQTDIHTYIHTYTCIHTYLHTLCVVCVGLFV